MALTRDKSEGTVFDPVRGLRGGPFKNPNYYKGTRLISVSNVEYTTLTQCRSWLPDPIGGIVWVALGAQDTSCYVPFYAGATDIPKSFSIGDHFRPRPRVGPLGLRLRRLPRPGRLQRRHRGRQGGPEEMGGRRPRPHRRDRRRGRRPLQAQSPGGGQVRHRVQPQQRPERRRRLVEARRRPVGEIQPSRTLRRRKAPRRPHSHGQPRMVEQGRPGLRCPERAREMSGGPA